MIHLRFETNKQEREKESLAIRVCCTSQYRTDLPLLFLLYKVLVQEHLKKLWLAEHVVCMGFVLAIYS